MAKRRLLNVSQYAIHRGVARSTVTDAIARKKFPVVEEDGMQKVDPEVADPLWDSANKIAKKRSGKKEGLIDMQTSKVKYDAKLSRLEFLKESGKYIEIDHVAKEWVKIVRAIRNAVMSLPDRTAHVVAGITDPAECHKAIGVEAGKILEGLSDELFKQARDL